MKIINLDRSTPSKIDEKLLIEKTSIYNELATHLMSDISNNVYTPIGFISHLGDGKYKELVNALITYVKNKFKLTADTDISDKVNEILHKWTIHHISGVHTESYNNDDNKSINIALLETSTLHQEITNKYREEITKYISNVPTIINDDVDKLLLRLVVVCKETGVNINNILCIKVDGFEDALYNISNKLTKFFEDSYPRTRKDVIYLSDLNLTW